MKSNKPARCQVYRPAWANKPCKQTYWSLCSQIWDMLVAECTLASQAGQSQPSSSGRVEESSGGTRHFSWYARWQLPSHRMMSLSCGQHACPSHTSDHLAGLCALQCRSAVDQCRYQ